MVETGCQRRRENMRVHLSPIAVAKATFAAEREMPVDGVTKLTLEHRYHAAGGSTPFPMRYSGYYCHTTKDTCLDDGDCTGKEYCDHHVIDGRWECKAPNMTCAIG